MNDCGDIGGDGMVEGRCHCCSAAVDVSQRSAAASSPTDADCGRARTGGSGGDGGDLDLDSSWEGNGNSSSLCLRLLRELAGGRTKCWTEIGQRKTELLHFKMG